MKDLPADPMKVTFNETLDGTYRNWQHPKLSMKSSEIVVPRKACYINVELISNVEYDT